MALVKLGALKQRMGIAHDRQDEVLQGMIDGVSAAVESFLGRKLAATDYTERYNGNGKSRIVLRQYPVLSVSSVKVNGRQVDDWDNDDWLLMRKSCFSDGIRNIEVQYRAGYETVPADIAEAVLLTAVQRMNEMEHKGIQSKTLAGETVTFSNFAASGGLPPAAHAILARYIRKV